MTPSNGSDALHARHEYDALLAGSAVAVTQRDVVLVHGPDAVSFLHGQLSQDIVRLSAGESTWSLHLQPTGKLGRLLRVTRLAGDAVLLDIDAGFGADVVAALERYKIRTKATIDALGERRQVSQRGTAMPPEPDAAGATDADAVRAGGAITVAAWPSYPGVDVLTSDPRSVGRLASELPGVETMATPASVRGSAFGRPVVAAAVWDAARIEAGVPVMGRELTVDLIPAEAVVVAWAVSFTKGCFVGQELAARIDSRGGNVPHHLRVLTSESALATGDDVHRDDRTVGSVTSAAPHPHGGWVALALLARAVEPGATVVVHDGTANVCALPRPDLASEPTA